MALASRAPSSHPFPAAVERFVGVFSRPLSWLWSHGFRMLGALDAVTLYLLMIAISFVRFGFSFDWDTYPLSHYFVGFSIATAIHLTVNYFAGLYEREPRLGRRPWLPKTFLATAIGVAVQGLAFVLLDRYLMPRLNLAAFLLARVVRPRVQPGARPASHGVPPGPPTRRAGRLTRSDRPRGGAPGGERSQRRSSPTASNDRTDSSSPSSPTTRPTCSSSTSPHSVRCIRNRSTRSSQPVSVSSSASAPARPCSGSARFARSGGCPSSRFVRTPCPPTRYDSSGSSISSSPSRRSRSGCRSSASSRCTSERAPADRSSTARTASDVTEWCSRA